MYTANIVDTVVFRSLGKHPNPHLDRLRDAVETAQTEIWVPELVYEELADQGSDETVTNPYLDRGIEEGWIRLATPSHPKDGTAGGESGLIVLIVDYFRIAPTPGSACTGKSLQ
jgi:hypothetical protein